MSGRPLHIVISDPHLKGGGQVRYAASLSRELVRLGHEVTIACKKGSVLTVAASEAQCPVQDTFRYRGGLRPLAWLHDIAEVRRLVRAKPVDILHANGSQDHWVAAVANRRLGRPVCVLRTRHNTYKVHNAWPNRVLNRAWTDYQIVVCETVRAQLARQPSFDPARMRTIHNGVDPEVFRPDEGKRREARDAFGYSEQDVVAGMAARLNVAKGHRFLFEAARGLRETFPNLRILLLGQGPIEHDLRRMVSEMELDRIVQFAGFRDDMPACLQAFDIGVQPSIACEASSFSLMEQMATGKPIVTSDHGGSKEIVRDGQDGFVVPAGETDPLADALARLLGDQAARAAMGRSARARVESDFTVQALAERTVDAYREALAVHARTR